MHLKSIEKVHYRESKHSFRDLGVKQTTNATVLKGSDGTIFTAGMRAKIL